MQFGREFETFFKDFSKELEEDNAALFVGAGLSVGAGFVDWKALLTPVADELGLSVEKENDLVSLAQFHANETGSRAKLNRLLIDEFEKQAGLTENHRLIARLPFGSYWTTNYDRLIETALERENKRADVKYTTAHITQTKPGRDTIVYKMHGDKEHPDQAIITKDDYERFHLDRSLYLAALSGSLVSKTFLFVGFSFNDPNLDYILSRVRVSVKKGDLRQHYAIVRKVNESDFEEKSECDYSKRRQELFVGDLKRFGIKALLIDEFSDITLILHRLHKIYKSRSVLISGAAEQFAPWSPNDAEKLIRNISGVLVREGYRVVSGFGYGIGSAVIAGALDEIYKGNRRSLQENLLLRPFPQGDNYRELHRLYREDLVSNSGISLFVFGNKLDENGNVVESPGVEKEFKMSVAAGSFVIPIGCTGSMAHTLWRQVIDNFDAFYPGKPKLKDLFLKLGDDLVGEDEAVSDIVLHILTELRR